MKCIQRSFYKIKETVLAEYQKYLSIEEITEIVLETVEPVGICCLGVFCVTRFGGVNETVLKNQNWCPVFQSADYVYVVDLTCKKIAICHSDCPTGFLLTPVRAEINTFRFNNTGYVEKSETEQV